MAAVTALALVVGVVLSGCASSSSPREGGSFEPAFGGERISGPAGSPPTEELGSRETSTLSANEAGSPLAAPAGSAPHSGRKPLPVLDENSTLNDYLEYAALNNPGLDAAFNRWKATLEKIPQVKTLPDPRFTYGFFFESVETRVGPQEHVLAIAQMFPWFGKLRLRGEKAFETSEIFRNRLEAAKLRLFYQVSNAYYEYYYLGRTIAVVRANRDLVIYLERVARIRYMTAAGTHPDVIRAQVELGKLEDRLLTLYDLQSPILARLNAALNRPLDAHLPLPTSAPEEAVAASADQMLAWLGESNPLLREIDHEVAKQDRAVELAQREYWPNVTFGLKYIVTDGAIMPGVSDSGKDPVLATVSVNLPVWRKSRRAAVMEARRMRLAARKRRVEMENSLGSALKLAYFGLRDAERKINLYRDTLLPKAQQSLKATETAYRAGSASFSDLVDAQRMSLTFTLSYEQALANYNQRLAELAMLVGREIPLEEQAAQGEDEGFDEQVIRGQEK